MAAMEDFQHMESKSLRDLQILSEIERKESVTQRSLSTKLGIAPADCLAFEDSPAGVEAALAAGMPVFALVTTHTKEEVSRATAVFEGFDQIELENLTP